MKDENKTKKELIEELKGLRRKVLRPENSESGNIPGNEVFRKRTHELNERVKELNCLYKLSVAINKPGIISHIGFFRKRKKLIFNIILKSP